MVIPLKVMISHFMDVPEETRQPIAFDCDHIELKVSNVSDEGWEITCLNSPVVRESDLKPSS